jgi:exopolysaccharide biosynthesis protein
MKKLIVIITLTIALLGVATYYYILYGGARNLASEEAVYTVSSQNIANEFNSNIEKSNAKYLEKAIAIKGIVSTVSAKQIILDNTIICDLKEIDATSKKGEEITLKGRFVGYDDLMGELKLDQCSVINND